MPNTDYDEGCTDGYAQADNDFDDDRELLDEALAACTSLELAGRMLHKAYQAANNAKYAMWKELDEKAALIEIQRDRLRDADRHGYDHACEDWRFMLEEHGGIDEASSPEATAIQVGVAVDLLDEALAEATELFDSYETVTMFHRSAVIREGRNAATLQRAQQKYLSEMHRADALAMKRWYAPWR